MKNIFYNLKSIELKSKTKTKLHTIVPKSKISVDINQLLNRVKVEEKKEKKNKIIFLGVAIILISSTTLLFI